MKKTFRFISLILAAVFLIAGTSLIVYADAGQNAASTPAADDGGENVADDGGEIDPGVDAGETPDLGDGNAGNDGGNSNNAGDNDSGNTGNGGNTGNDGNNNSVDNGANDNQVDNQTPAEGNGDANTSQADGGYDSGYDSNQYYEGESSENETPQYIDDSPLYYGDAGNYDYNSSSDNDRQAGKIDTQLYPATVDDSIKAQKWEDLEVPGSKKDVKLNSGSADGDVSFAAMKKNNGSGDDMGFIPYLGIALVAMAVLGILYFIVATVTSRKAAAAAGGHNDRTISTPADTAKSKKSGKKNRYADGYDDGYSATRRGSKADTAEIHLPRRFK